MIVVGVDYSEGSATAAAVALRLGRVEEVRFVHVCAVRGSGDRPRERSEWCERLNLRREDVEVRIGVPWVELVRTASQRSASLLVAGTHGRTGFQPLRLGTTAELVALRSQVPVVLVPRMRWTSREVGHVHERELLRER